MTASTKTGPRGKAKILTDAQQRAALAVLTDPRERAMFLLSTKAMLRAIEIAGLQWRHVREDMLELTADIVKGGKKERQVPLAKVLREALDAHRAASERVGEYDPVFPNQHLQGRPLTGNAVQKWFAYVYRVRLGWADGYRSHSGRRTGITNGARRIHQVGGSLADVQRMAGHSNLNTTQGYIESSSDARKKIVEML